MDRYQDTRALSIRMQQRDVAATFERADIVIIGNGIAGLTAAIEARRYDADKRIVIITDQPYPTINTPALKQFSINRLRREQLLAYPPGTERSLNIHIVNAHVERIHATSKYLELAGGRVFGYGRLLIATGSRSMNLPEETPGLTFDGVITLHRLEDFLDLRRRLPEVREAVVVGGGTHANEVVMSLLHWGVRVHWLVRGKTFLASTFDNTASELILNKVRRAGALVYTETQVTAVVGRVGMVAGVITSTGEMLGCQLVISCIGTRPAVGLARQCTEPMIANNGILVDDRFRTNVRDIYAAGDVAALLNPQTGEYEPRAQWYSAVTQGRIAGAMMVGHSDIPEGTLGIQWHATRLSKLSMLTVGDPLGLGMNGQQMTVYTDMSRGGYRRLAAVGDRLVGYLSVGTTQPDGLSIKRLIEEGFSIRDILKPLLKGKFDVHGYLRGKKAHLLSSIGSQPLPIVEETQVLQWPEMSRKEPVYQSEPAHLLPAGTGLTAKYGVPTGQFVKPGFVDKGYSSRHLAVVRPYEQPNQGRETDPLLVRIGKSHLVRDHSAVAIEG